MKAVAILLCAATLTLVTPTAAEDMLRIAIPQRGTWDTSISEIGQKAGIFKKHGLNLDLLFTGAGAEVIGGSIGGSIDLSIASGISTVLGATATAHRFASARDGRSAGNLLVRAPADSPIKTLADMNGKTIGYSAAGSSSHAALLALLAQEKINAKPTALGGVTASITAGMSGQVDAAWSAMPYGLKDYEEGKIRIIARAADVKVLQGRTVRVNFTSASTLATRRIRSSATWQATRRRPTTCIRRRKRSRCMPRSAASRCRSRRKCKPWCRRTQPSQSDRRHGFGHGRSGRDQVPGGAAGAMDISVPQEAA